MPALRCVSNNCGDISEEEISTNDQNNITIQDNIQHEQYFMLTVVLLLIVFVWISVLFALRVVKKMTAMMGCTTDRTPWLNHELDLEYQGIEISEDEILMSRKKN
ncbi:hypothetical protein VCUG_01021 [Vavraia culicis subsp. floridensis]|uniref:Uncharacterized protein n=1 Tax=Vavraia culicis (isolate floridensis) TaxID=948595 RepID=L2GV41_VAVCU|nr:uncharacterized protein VCUG_01021 [Vavraia culicis subsp. floridensis]ELA47489.1 hypothetical protein VCUG_01021 [Vavraia culicis subsp. floridensis]